MSSYIRSILTDIRYVIASSFEAVQHFVAAGPLERAYRATEDAEDEARELRRRLVRAETANRTLAGNNRDMRRALDARAERAGRDALIAGRTRFGDIVSDTALTYDEVYLPTHGVTLLVSESHFVLRGDDNPDLPDIVVSPYDENENKGPGWYRALAFSRV